MRYRDLTTEQRHWIDNRYDTTWPGDVEGRAQFLRTGKVNTEMLLREYEWMKKEQEKSDAGKPSHWLQRDWIKVLYDEGKHCGTACCLAGHVVEQEYGTEKTFEWANRMTDDQEVYMVERKAQDLLGLNQEQCDQLFEEFNNLADMRIGISILTGKDLT